MGFANGCHRKKNWSVPATEAEADMLKHAMLCCAGLLVSILMMTYGVDLSPGFLMSCIFAEDSAWL